MTPAPSQRRLKGRLIARTKLPRVALGPLAAPQDLSGDTGPLTVVRAASRIGASRLRTLTTGENVKSSRLPCMTVGEPRFASWNSDLGNALRFHGSQHGCPQEHQDVSTRRSYGPLHW